VPGRSRLRQVQPRRSNRRSVSSSRRSGPVVGSDHVEDTRTLQRIISKCITCMCGLRAKSLRFCHGQHAIFYINRNYLFWKLFLIAEFVAVCILQCVMIYRPRIDSLFVSFFLLVLCLFLSVQGYLYWRNKFIYIIIRPCRSVLAQTAYSYTLAEFRVRSVCRSVRW